MRQAIESYIKEHFYELPKNQIDDSDIQNYIKFLEWNYNELFSDILHECCAHELKTSIALYGHNGAGVGVIDAFQKELYCRFLNDALERCKEIHNNLEDSEPDDHGMTNSDFLMGDL